MAVQIVHDKDHHYACLICTTSDTAFGPAFLVYNDPGGWDARDHAECFLDWIADGEHLQWALDQGIRAAPIGGNGCDPREYDAADLMRLYAHWRDEYTDGDGHLVVGICGDGSTDWSWRTDGTLAFPGRRN